MSNSITQNKVIVPQYKSDRSILFNYDCLEVLPTLESGSIDAAIYDPPYGVGFEYGEHDDDRHGYEAWILKAFSEIKRVAKVVILTPGITNLFIYPRPLWTSCYFKPGSTRRNGTGGFNEWEPILIYADKLKLVTDAKRFPDIANHDPGNTHPCPKPVNVFKWLVDLSNADTILDPFMGSGTTGVAAMKLGRRFIGIEKSEKYFEIAKRRIEQAESQLALFTL